MFIVRIIPLQKGGHLGELTYFSRTPYEPGTFLQVPVRNRMISAMVIETSPAPALKSALRNMTFSLKKLPEQEHAPQLSPATIITAESVAAHYGITVGEALFALLPSGIRDGERTRIYRTLVRESFARGGSVMILAPTSVEVTELEKALSGGIEDRTISIHANLTPRSEE